MKTYYPFHNPIAEVNPNSIIQTLSHVIKITPLEDGKFDVREMCDSHYAVTLTAEQLKQWGCELIQLSSNSNATDAEASAMKTEAHIYPPCPDCGGQLTEEKSPKNIPEEVACIACGWHGEWGQ